MRILFDKTDVAGVGSAYVAVEDKKIIYVGEEKPKGKFDRVIDTKNKLMISGLYNCHSHAVMQFLRGYGEDMLLNDWLENKIYPAEDKLNSKIASVCSYSAIAEMIRNGICSFSDMYYFCDETVEAVGQSGIMTNISRSVVMFDDSEVCSETRRYKECAELYKQYNNTFDGRVKVEMSLHAEYTNTEKMCYFLADEAKIRDCGIHIHLSETEFEHKECIKRHNMTPTAFFNKCCVFDTRTTAAHCVWVTDEDIDILKEKGVFVVHNPCSNMKLGSGVMPLYKMLQKGIPVCFGTDSSASNNTLDILKEMYTASLLEKVSDKRPDLIKAREFYTLATLNGAMCQGREHSGEIKIGNNADIVLIDMDSVHNIPSYDMYYSLLYSVNSSDVRLNMVNGKILYENGEYTTVDIEKTKYELRKIVDSTFKK